MRGMEKNSPQLEVQSEVMNTCAYNGSCWQSITQEGALQIVEFSSF